MVLTWGWIAFIGILIFLVAFLYASVGHGGGSGYLAVFALFAFSPLAMASTVLMMNVLVTTVGFVLFFRRGHFSMTLIWPFLVTSVPASYIGGWLAPQGVLYAILLGLLLLYASYKLFWSYESNPDEIAHPSLSISLMTGALIGLLAGMIGIGGGIFLSPILILFGWATAKTTAGVSTLFVWANSVAGLAGRFFAGAFSLEHYWVFIPVALVGGWLGGTVGASYVSDKQLKQLLAVVLFIASLKMLYKIFI